MIRWGRRKLLPSFLVFNVSLYLERGMNLQEAPFGHAIKQNKSKEIKPKVCEVRDNLMYTKYLYTLKRPEKYQRIWVDWKLN